MNVQADVLLEKQVLPCLKEQFNIIYSYHCTLCANYGTKARSLFVGPNIETGNRVKPWMYYRNWILHLEDGAYSVCHSQRALKTKASNCASVLCFSLC